MSEEKKGSDLITIVQSDGATAEFKKAIPNHIGAMLSADRFQRVALTEMRKNPDILKCTPASVMSSLVQAAQLGLEPGHKLGLAYLIPYGKECTLIIGYRGLLALARRSGEIKKLEAFLVYAGDEFDYWYGLDPGIKHRVIGEPSAAAVKYAYAVCHFKDGTTQFEVMTRKQIDVIRDMGRRNPVWNQHYEEMARKTVLRRICKYLPLSPELSDALRVDSESDDVITLPAQPDMGKYKALVADDAGEQAAKREAAEHQIALEQLEMAWVEAKSKKLDPEQIIGVTPDDACKESIAFLEAATEKLRGAIPK